MARHTLFNNLQETVLKGNIFWRPFSRTYNGRGAVQEAAIPRFGSFRIFDKFCCIVSEGVAAKTASIVFAPNPATKHNGALTCSVFVRECSIEIVVGAGTPCPKFRAYSPRSPCERRVSRNRVNYSNFQNLGPLTSPHVCPQL